MSAAAPVTNSFNWQTLLGQFQAFPCVSSTHAVLNLRTLVGALAASADPQPAEPSAEPFAATAIKALEPNMVANTVAMALISYVALSAFSTLSLYVNGAVGIGKVALSAVTMMTDYKTAQNFLEEGVFHMLVAASDFAIASFVLIRAAVAIGYGLAPHGKGLSSIKKKQTQSS
jgi:hypothetical protein